jgi:hypothetical protein
MRRALSFPPKEHSMPHIGLKVSDELYQHARLAAARRNMSLSLLMRNFLTTLDQTPAEGKDDSQFFNGYFPPMPQRNMAAEYLRLARQITGRQR